MPFRHLLALVAVLGLMNTVGYSQPSVDIISATPPYQLGSEVAPFAIRDVSGELHDLGETLGANTIVIYFWNFRCPMSRVYENRLQTLMATYAPQNITFWVVDSNATNSDADILEYHAQHALPYPVLKDDDNQLADQFSATKTPEVYIIGVDKRLQYHGAIDNNHNPDKATHPFVENALESLAQNKEPEVKHFPAFGCAIKRTVTSATSSSPPN